MDVPKEIKPLCKGQTKLLQYYGGTIHIHHEGVFIITKDGVGKMLPETIQVWIDGVMVSLKSLIRLYKQEVK